jgi:hypothetical protein
LLPIRARQSYDDAGLARCVTEHAQLPVDGFEFIFASGVEREENRTKSRKKHKLIQEEHVFELHACPDNS